MPLMIAILDRQHFGKPNRRSEDLGAGVDLDGDGVIEAHEWETALTPIYLSACQLKLEALGVEVVTFPYEGQKMSYKQRHAEACRLARENPEARGAYLAAHLNAGGGNYGLVIHDERSSGGKALAESIANGMRHYLPELYRVLVRGASSDSWARGLTTIRGIWSGPANLSGVCFEPLFMDNEDHQDLIKSDGLQRAGLSAAVGIEAWLNPDDQEMT